MAADMKMFNTIQRILWEHFLASEASVQVQMILTVVGNVSKTPHLTMDFYIPNKACYNKDITK